MKAKNLDKNANVTLKALKLEFETFGPMSLPVLKKLCVGKPKLKRQARTRLRFQNKKFIQKNAFDSIIQCLEEIFDQNTAKKK